ncbi:PREDICTED: meiosis-specific kinetochore protein isoform X2 [Ficedula albicollis]|uniref:meiosis-specific kinetochore protein isoform X2 n=1 Tax=Ficedula albicollis TaxID=59894 RepID=UPI00035A2626|nr:PREDICTED: meiosis-specific kinetochore protein isoform X2 [Ficedula albicollis]
MERDSWLHAPRTGKEPRKKRRASPLPGAAALPGSRAGVSQVCRRRLFGGAGPRGPEPACKRLSRPAAELEVQEAEPVPAGKGGGKRTRSALSGRNKKFHGKNLPKIKENVEYTEESSLYNQSNQATVRETTDFKRKEEEPEESCVPLKESEIINFESKESLKNSEVTSSTEITLPTGVSTILIECLDKDSAADCSTASDSLKTYSSPETFRDDDLEKCNFYSVDLGKYKNSTLLDSSKAVTIDKIPQISNLSAILEPVPEDFPDRCIRRKRPSNCYYSSSALSTSTTLAGKKLCKITAARERTPDLKSCMRCRSPLGPESKHDNQTAKAKRLKKKESSFNPLEGDSSSFRQLDAPENSSARSEGLTAEVLPTKPTDAVVITSTMLIMEENKVLKNPDNAQPVELDLILSPVRKALPEEDLFLNTTSPFGNSNEIVPASLSSEKEIIPQSPEEKNILKPLCDRREICSIVRTSPSQSPSQLQQVQVNWKEFFLSRGVAEDIIAITRNCICCKQK